MAPSDNKFAQELKPGIWDWDVLAQRLIWDQQMFQIYDLSLDRFNGTYETWHQTLHPEDRDKGDEAVRRALRDERPRLSQNFWKRF